MGSILSSGFTMASLACQSAICCCNLSNCLMTAGNGVNGISARAAKIFYVVLLGVATILALTLRYKGDDLNINLGAWEVHCSDTHDTYDISTVGGVQLREQSSYVFCKGDAAVYRIAFILSCFFAVMTTTTFISGRATHRGFWGIKLLLLFFGLLLCFFIPNSFFDNTGYAWVARVVSMFFLLLQILILIDFAYEWNETWVAYAFPSDGSENNNWLIAILSCAAILYLVALVGIPLIFTFYGECGLGVGFATVTLIGVIVLTGLTLFRDKIVGEEYEGAILPAAVVASYATYLCWSALESNPDEECKPARSDASETFQLVVGILVSVLSLCWTSMTVTDGVQALVTGESTNNASGIPNASTPLYSVGDGERVETETFESGDDEDDASESHLWVFHLTMFLASNYMAMLVTNWGVGDDDIAAHGNENGQVGLASAWVKFLSGFGTIALYIHTLMAPRCMPDREW